VAEIWRKKLDDSTLILLHVEKIWRERGEAQQCSACQQASLAQRMYHICFGGRDASVLFIVLAGER